MKMFKIEDFMRPDLADLTPYQVKDSQAKIKLDANESGYDLAPEIKAEIAQALGETAFNRYPDATAKGLRRQMGEWLGLEPEQILVGNGSNEIIQIILLALGGVNSRVIYPSPTFSMYGVHASITGTTRVEVPLRSHFLLDTEKIRAEAAHPQTKLIFLCSPNNPTGNCLPPEDIRQIIETSGCIVVVDEAYAEFSGQNFLPWIEQYPNLLIIRTFSKALGLAGARVGYLCGQAGVIREISKVRLPYNLNAFSQAMVGVCLRHRTAFKTIVQEIIKEREAMFAYLQECPGIEVFPSQTNFLLFRPRLPAQVVLDELLKAGVLIRDLSSAPQLANCLRVTVGTPEENRVFCQALQEIVTSNASLT